VAEQRLIIEPDCSSSFSSSISLVLRGISFSRGRASILSAQSGFPAIGMNGWIGTLDEEEGLLETSSLSTGVR
jgi:hypothetical protein